MGSPFGSRMFSVGTKNFLVFLWVVQALRGGITLFRGSGLMWASALDRNGGLFSHPYSELLRDDVTLWVKCGGRFPLARERRFSLVVRPRSFQMGLVPLSEVSLRALSLASRFLVVLATAPHLGVLQALSGVVTFVGSVACIYYLPQFVAQSESLTRSIPRSILVEYLSNFAAGIDDDLLLCPVRPLRICLNRTHSVAPVRLVAPLAPCQRMRYPSFCARSFM